MKALIGCAAIIFALATITLAEAKGCLKGAAVGGVAGHFAGHHEVLGATADRERPEKIQKTNHQSR